MKGLTKNQAELLMAVKAGGPDGPLDFDQLLDQLSWTPSKESAQFTIRALIAKGVLEKLPELQLRRSRKRICYQLTPEGLACLDPRAPLAVAVEKAKPSLPGALVTEVDVAEDEVGLVFQNEDDFFDPGVITVEEG